MGSRQPAGEDLTSAEMLNLRYMTIIIHDNPWFVNMISIKPQPFEESTLLGVRADSNEHSAGMFLPSASTPSRKNTRNTTALHFEADADAEPMAYQQQTISYQQQNSSLSFPHISRNRRSQPD